MTTTAIVVKVFSEDAVQPLLFCLPVRQSEKRREHVACRSCETGMWKKSYSCFNFALRNSTTAYARVKIDEHTSC